jgi:hypothetical protein
VETGNRKDIRKILQQWIYDYVCMCQKRTFRVGQHMLIISEASSPFYTLLAPRDRNPTFAVFSVFNSELLLRDTVARLRVCTCCPISNGPAGLCLTEMAVYYGFSSALETQSSSDQLMNIVIFCFYDRGSNMSLQV